MFLYGASQGLYLGLLKLDEVLFSRYNFEVAGTSMLLKQFDMYEQECKDCYMQTLLYPHMIMY